MGCGTLLLGLGAWKGPLEINKDLTTPGLHLASISAEGTALAVQHGRVNSVSGDGRHVAFQRFGEQTSLLLRDTHTGTVRQICPADGGGAVGGCANPMLSRDSRFVAFESDRDDFAPGSRPALRDVFVKDLRTGVVRLVSGGPQLARGSAATLTGMSADGRRIAFATGRSEKQVRAWVADETGSVRMVGDRPSTNPQLSADGNVVVFLSDRYRSAPGAATRSPGLFARDLRTGTLRSVDSLVGGLPPDYIVTRFTAPSADGARVAFTVASAGDERSPALGTYVVDLGTGRVIHRIGPRVVGGAIALSADGFRLLFDWYWRVDTMDERIPDYDLFVDDLRTGRRHQVSPKVFGADYVHPTLSADGSTVVFGAGFLEVPERTPDRDSRNYDGTYYTGVYLSRVDEAPSTRTPSAAGQVARVEPEV